MVLIFSCTATLVIRMISNGCKLLEVGVRRAASKIRSTLSAAADFARIYLFGGAAPFQHFDQFQVGFPVGKMP